MKQVIPQLELQAATIEIRFRAKLEYCQRIIPLAAAIEDMPSWSSDGVSAVLKNTDRHCSVEIQPKFIRYKQDSSDGELLERWIHHVCEKILIPLDVRAVTSLKVAHRYLAPVEMDYKQLMSLVSVKLLAQDPSFRRCFPGRHTDFHATIDFEDSPVDYQLAIGPIQKDQIEDWINFDKDNHLHPSDMEVEYGEIVAGYPEQALFVGLDGRIRGQQPSNSEVLPSLLSIHKRVQQTAVDFKNYIFAVPEEK